MRMVVRDTANSMETMLALGELLEPGWFIASTVDAVIPQIEFVRFVNESRRKIEECGDKNLAGVLAVTRWRGEAKPLFADVTSNGLILRAGQPSDFYGHGGTLFSVDANFRLCRRRAPRGSRRAPPLSRDAHRTRDGAGCDRDRRIDRRGRSVGPRRRAPRNTEDTMSNRALGIYREPEFSPGKVEADAAILDAVAVRAEARRGRDPGDGRGQLRLGRAAASGSRAADVPGTARAQATGRSRAGRRDSDQLRALDSQLLPRFARRRPRERWSADSGGRAGAC